MHSHSEPHVVSVVISGDVVCGVVEWFGVDVGKIGDVVCVDDVEAGVVVGAEDVVGIVDDTAGSITDVEVAGIPVDAFGIVVV